MAAEPGVGLFARDQQEVMVAHPLAALEINLLVFEAQRAWIIGVGIAVEIGEDDDVDAQGTKDLKKRRAIVDGALVIKHINQMKMKVAHQHLEARHRLENVIVRIGHHIALGCAAILRAEIKIDGHSLPGSRRRIVESKVARLLPRLVRAVLPRRLVQTIGGVANGVFGLAGANGKSGCAVLAVIDVPGVNLVFAGKEKYVRSREKGERTAAGLNYAKAIARAYAHRLLIGRAPEIVFLPGPRRVAPDEPCVFPGAEAFQPARVDVSDRWFFCAGYHLLP